MEIDPAKIEKLDSEILDYQDEIEKIKMTIPSNWEGFPIRLDRKATSKEAIKVAKKTITILIS